MENLNIIAHIQSEFPQKFGIPRQSGVVEGLEARVVFTPDYRSPEALRGLEKFSHLWLIWGFSGVERTGWSPTVRPPRLGGNARLGVFATRSPYRPNPLGLSCVKIGGLDRDPELGPVIRVLGADLMDGTPIYDIKPYIPYTDCRPEASGGFADSPPGDRLQVDIDDRWVALLPPDRVEVLRQVLAQDPRPSYQRDPDRVYGMSFGGFEVKFRVLGNCLTVSEIIDTRI